jgi:orotidine-5'-phosphate decarboxylase
MDTPLIVALDFPTAPPALELAARLKESGCRVKVGKELFTRAGPALVERLVADGFQVFLDLKYHDIPNTVAAACRAAADLGVWMLNVHAQGGPKMLAAAREAIPPGGPRLIAVTILTSLDQAELDALGLPGTPADNVLRLARLAERAGLDGVVCSPQEIGLLRQHLRRDFRLVTPGIRPAGSAQDDQRRVMTPRQALGAGADYLVIGRPITAADDPLAALRAIQASL